MDDVKTAYEWCVEYNIRPLDLNEWCTGDFYDSNGFSTYIHFRVFNFTTRFSFGNDSYCGHGFVAFLF